MTGPTPPVGDPRRARLARLAAIVGVVGLVVAALSHAGVLALLPPRIVPYAIAFSGAVLAMARPLAGRHAPRAGVRHRQDSPGPASVDAVDDAEARDVPAPGRRTPGESATSRTPPPPDAV